jgi:hypothetical protein
LSIIFLVFGQRLKDQVNEGLLTFFGGDAACHSSEENARQHQQVAQACQSAQTKSLRGQRRQRGPSSRAAAQHH